MAEAAPQVGLDASCTSKLVLRSAGWTVNSLYKPALLLWHVIQCNKVIEQYASQNHLQAWITPFPRMTAFTILAMTVALGQSCTWLHSGTPEFRHAQPVYDKLCLLMCRSAAAAAAGDHSVAKQLSAEARSVKAAADEAHAAAALKIEVMHNLNSSAGLVGIWCTQQV